MMKELKSVEPYEVAPGCPTISFDLADGSLMLGYSSFASGQFVGGKIELGFQEWRIEIEGDNLAEVWRLLQMQDIRGVRRSESDSEGEAKGCRIRSIRAEKEQTK